MSECAFEANSRAMRDLEHAKITLNAYKAQREYDLQKITALIKRVTALEEAARDYMTHTNSGMYRDKTGMRPEPSPQYERLFNLLHTEARAILQVKP